MKLFFCLTVVFANDFAHFHRANPENGRAPEFAPLNFGFETKYAVEPNQHGHEKSLETDHSMDSYRARLYRRELQSMIDNLTIGPGHTKLKTAKSRYQNTSRFKPAATVSRVTSRKTSRRQRLFMRHHITYKH